MRSLQQSPSSPRSEAAWSTCPHNDRREWGGWLSDWPKGSDRGASIKDDEQYEALRDEGMSKEKAAGIANTHNPDAARGGQSASHEEWTLEELYERAQEVGTEGRSQMSQEDLIEALRED